jgi:ribosomal protein S18 acetylase RimI-like enzyme
MTKPDPCDFLDWDSDFFGFRIGRVRGNILTPSLIKQVEAWSADNHIRCLYFLAHSDRPETTYLAEQHNYHLVDVRTTYEHPLKTRTFASKEILRPAAQPDLPKLEAMAYAGLSQTRFFYDTGFPTDRVKSLYAIWITRDFQDPSAMVLVAVSAENSPMGFVSLRHKPGEGTAQISLVGVNDKSRGKGIGQMLINGALASAVERGASSVSVVTQGRNIAANRLYQKCGFLTRSVELWYHKWYSPEVVL